MPDFRFAAVAAAAVLAGSIAGTASAGRQGTPLPVTASSASTAIVVAATNDPLRVAGSDGRDHLEYDLIVTNGFVASVVLSAVEVFDPGGATLLRLEGDALVEATQPLLGRGPIAEIPASGAVGLVIDVAVPPGQEVTSLDHRIAYDVAPDAPGRSLIGAFTVDGPELPVDPRPTTVIAPPLRGDGWLAGDSCCSPISLHRSVRLPVDGDRFAKIETFAIDWLRLRDGRLFEGDGSQLEQWFGFGAEIYAVADGTVVAVQDGRPEEAPGRAPENVDEPGDYGGNTISIEIAPSVYAFYAHFQPGSIAVAVGDRVVTGQPLGLLGNTGNTSAPHLHFGLLDDPDPFVGTSLPMAFDRWTWQGTVEPTAYYAALSSDPGSPPLEPSAEPTAQVDTLQLNLDVADFG